MPYSKVRKLKGYLQKDGWNSAPFSLRQILKKMNSTQEIKFWVLQVNSSEGSKEKRMIHVGLCTAALCILYQSQTGSCGGVSIKVMEELQSETRMVAQGFKAALPPFQNLTLYNPQDYPSRSKKGFLQIITSRVIESLKDKQRL